MSVRDTLASATAVRTPAITRRAALLASLSLCERLLAPAAAWALFELPARDKAILAIALSVAFTLRTFAERTFLARTEADLFDRVIAGLLHGDILRANVLPHEDARAEIGQSVYQTALTMTQELPATAANIAASVLLIILVVATEPAQVVLAAVGLTVVAAGALVWSRGRVQGAVTRAWEAKARVYEKLVDAIDGRLEIVAAGRRSAFLAESRERTRAWGTAGARLAAATALGGRMPLLAIAVSVGGALAVGSGLRAAFPVTLAQIALFASMTPAVVGVAQGLQALTRSQRWVRIVAQVVGGARRAEQGVKPTPKPPAPIALEAVSFHYADMPPEIDVLRDVTFAWTESQVVALAGANGSGKSTCLRLLLCLAPADSGVLRVAGQNLQDLDADAWRARIAFLPQRPYLPPRSTVRDAIRFLAPEASDERMLGALGRVVVLPALERKGSEPLGVPVDELSVGQRQRVALARLLCRDASVYLLDEPDANLDREGIAVVAEIVQELRAAHMVAFAAHTPELLAAADHVVTLDAGRVVRDATQTPKTQPGATGAR